MGMAIILTTRYGHSSLHIRCFTHGLSADYFVAVLFFFFFFFLFFLVLRWVSFVGSHMDVVPANPEEWKRNPFELTVEGDVLHGRGVTDCLGHVAMLTIFFKQLAILRPKLRVGVSAVFIANEENSSILGVGIDELQKQGEIDYLKKGPLFWVDSANIGPTLGTGGIMTWELVRKRRKHSKSEHPSADRHLNFKLHLKVCFCLSLFVFLLRL